jgi:hypothetical protein
MLRVYDTYDIMTLSFKPKLKMFMTNVINIMTLHPQPLLQSQSVSKVSNDVSVKCQ